MYAKPRLAGILNHFSEAQYLLKPCVNLPTNKSLCQCGAPGEWGWVFPAVTEF